ncbi:carbon-nitrogen hydrolase family protein [bacterium D16-51]|nr:carbon-nitrogen hydrolase family protein [bacterium D16-59]RKI62856.1 carbon-nitrogen hydrolase family protein [bacterium D16-51]
MFFRVAILQKRAINAQISKNMESIIKALKEAAKNNADILLLPECFITGYDLPMTYEKSISDGDENIKKICNFAKKHRIGVVLTAFTKGKDLPQNTAFVINKTGKILMKYSKVHTCDFADEKAVEAGKEFKVCDFDGIRLGVMICYDREYPESARILMLKGAEIILVPNDCGSMKPRIQALATRAYENMLGVAMANPNGKNAGNSCAYSPICWDKNGNCVENKILLADDITEGIFYADFDMDAIREYRNREMMGNTFRKVDAYGDLLNKTIREPFIRQGQVTYGL